MELSDWIPALSTSGLLAALLWMSRQIIQTRLTKSVQHEFDQKLEIIRTEHRKSEEMLRADLRSKETQIEVLRSGALASLVSRQSALEKRRLEAIDQLWSAVTILKKFQPATKWMAVVKFDEITKAAAENSDVQKLFETIAGAYDPIKIDVGEASKARPFISPIAWAIFTAYHTIVALAVAQLHIIKSGLGLQNILDSRSIENLVKVALPHQTEFIVKHGTDGYYYLVDELESRLLDELRQMLDGKEIDKASITQAAAILEESNRVLENMKNVQTPIRQFPQ